MDIKTSLFSVSGISCGKCVEHIEGALKSVDQLTSVHVYRKPDRVEISSTQNFNLDEFQVIFKELGLNKYTFSEFIENSPSEEVKSSMSVVSRLFPLFLIISYLLVAILTIAFVQSDWRLESIMFHYMAGFFLIFSFFKFLNLNGFVDAFQTYDPIAKCWKPYGYFYASLELVWGLSYLIFPLSIFLNLSVLLILGISSLGVWRAVRSQKEIQCACLGTLFNLPMTHVTMVENISMLSMAGLAVYNSLFH